MVQRHGRQGNMCNTRAQQRGMPASLLCLPAPSSPQFSKGYRTIQVKSGKAYIRKASKGLLEGGREVMGDWKRMSSHLLSLCLRTP